MSLERSRYLSQFSGSGSSGKQPSEGEQSLLPAVISRPGGLLVPYKGGAIRPSEVMHLARRERGPEFTHALVLAFWKAAAESIGEEVEIPKPKFTLEDSLEANRNGLQYFNLPEQYSTRQDLEKLVAMFPFAKGPYTHKEKGYQYLGGNITPTSYITHGWFNTEWQPTPPLTGFSEIVAEESRLPSLRREGMTLNIYIAASAFHRLLTGRFFDEGRYTRLFGSMVNDAQREPEILVVKYDSPSVESEQETGVLEIRRGSEIGIGGSGRIGIRTVGLSPKYGKSVDAPITTAHLSVVELDRLWAKRIGTFFKRLIPGSKDRSNES